MKFRFYYQVTESGGNFGTSDVKPRHRQLRVLSGLRISTILNIDPIFVHVFCFFVCFSFCFVFRYRFYHKKYRMQVNPFLNFQTLKGKTTHFSEILPQNSKLILCKQVCFCGTNCSRSIPFVRMMARSWACK